MQKTPSSPAEANPRVDTAPSSASGIPLSPLPMMSTSKAMLSSFVMALMFVLGLAWIQLLFNRSTPDGDNIVLALKYCSMGAGYSLLALPVWGIFDTLRRTHLYATGPKYIIACGYIGLISSFLYFSYHFVLWALTGLF